MKFLIIFNFILFSHNIKQTTLFIFKAEQPNSYPIISIADSILNQIQID
jgi:hypothetical protein